MDPVHCEVGGNPFFSGRHGAPPQLADADQVVGATGELGGFEKGGELRFPRSRQAPLELDVQLFRARFDQGEGSFLSLVGLVGGLGRGQAAEVGAQVGKPRQQLLGADEDSYPVADVVVLSERGQGSGLLFDGIQVALELLLEAAHLRPVERGEVAAQIPVHWLMALVAPASEGRLQRVRYGDEIDAGPVGDEAQRPHQVDGRRRVPQLLANGTASNSPGLQAGDLRADGTEGVAAGGGYRNLQDFSSRAERRMPPAFRPRTG